MFNPINTIKLDKCMAIFEIMDVLIKDATKHPKSEGETQYTFCNVAESNYVGDNYYKSTVLNIEAEAKQRLYNYNNK